MQQSIPQELAQLTKYLSLELEINLPDFQNKNNEKQVYYTRILYFGYQCLNMVMSKLFQQWQNIDLPDLQSENQSCVINVQEWRKFIKMIQQCFLEEEENAISDNQLIDVEDIIVVFQILCQGCEAARKSKENLMANQKIKKQLKNTKNTKNTTKTKQRPKTSNKDNKKKKIVNQPLLGSQLEKQIIETVSKTIKSTKKAVANPKITAANRDKQANSAVEKAKRRFQYTTNNIHKQNKKTAENIKKSKQKNTGGIKIDAVDKSYYKYIQQKHKNLNSQVESQQLKYYLELRDKKVAYIRHIHQLVEKLERQRQAELRRKQKEQNQQQKKQMKVKIEQVQTLFSHNMNQLQQSYKEKKKIQAVQSIQQIKVCRQIQSNVKAKKKQDLEHMKNLWQAQCQKLNLITGDQQKMKNKLIEIYRKNRI